MVPPLLPANMSSSVSALRAAFEAAQYAERTAAERYASERKDCDYSFANFVSEEKAALLLASGARLDEARRREAAAAKAAESAFAEFHANNDPEKMLLKKEAADLAWWLRCGAKVDVDDASAEFDELKLEAAYRSQIYMADREKVNAAWEDWQAKKEASSQAAAAAEVAAAEAAAAEAAAEFEAERVKAYWEARREADKQAAKLAERARQQLPGSCGDIWPRLQRNFNKLTQVVPDGAYICVESKKDKWEGVFRHGGGMYSGPFFEVQGKKYFSPTALCQAHSERITDNHPRVTKPGNGWVHINLAPKPGHKWGPTLALAYDSHAW